MAICNLSRNNKRLPAICKNIVQSTIYQSIDYELLQLMSNNAKQSSIKGNISISWKMAMWYNTSL